MSDNYEILKLFTELFYMEYDKIDKAFYRNTYYQFISWKMLDLKMGTFIYSKIYSKKIRKRCMKISFLAHCLVSYYYEHSDFMEKIDILNNFKYFDILKKAEKKYKIFLPSNMDGWAFKKKYKEAEDE